MGRTQTRASRSQPCSVWSPARPTDLNQPPGPSIFDCRLANHTGSNIGNAS